MTPSRARRAGLRLTLTLLLVAGGSRLAAGADPGRPVRLTWFGQSCFLLESAKGARVVMDPIPRSLGYPLPKDIKADVVTISHEHFDHTGLDLVAGKPRVLRGLTADKKGWNKIDTTIKDVAIRTVGVYHDDHKGTERGLNTIFIFETNGLRIAHLGDLGHALDSGQLKAVGGVDVVLIPVGGAFTVDAAQASKVIDQLRPRLIVVPMHFKTPANQVKELAAVDAFLADKSNIRRENGATLSLEGLKAGVTPQLVVLEPKAGYLPGLSM